MYQTSEENLTLSERLRSFPAENSNVQLDLPQLGQLMSWATMSRASNCKTVMAAEDDAHIMDHSDRLLQDLIDAIELSLETEHVGDTKDLELAYTAHPTGIGRNSSAVLSEISAISANKMPSNGMESSIPLQPASNLNLETSNSEEPQNLKAPNSTFVPQNLQSNQLFQSSQTIDYSLSSNLKTGGDQKIDNDSSQSYMPQDPVTFNEITERIWRFNDQRASLYLQERLRKAIPMEFEEIIEAINMHLEPLMKHRFGNFLVQCMLELAKFEEINHFADFITGRIAEMSKNQFCCHVIQRLLDVSPLVIQARVAAELLDDVVDTMTSPFGTHVWQKLFHLSWSPELPSIVTMANNAVHLEPNTNGWMTITSTQAGCATIKSFLSSSQMDNERQECVKELLSGIDTLMTQPYGSALVPKLAIISTTRARTMTLIFSHAYEYCKHPIASTVILCLLKLKIPSFPVRLSVAIAPYKTELMADVHGSIVIAALQKVQGNL